MSVKKCVFLMFLLVPLSAHSQTAGNRLTHELYVKSGLEMQVQQIPALIEVGFDQAVRRDDNLRNAPEATISGIKGLIKSAFDTDQFKRTITEEVEADLSRNDVEKVLEWLDSGVGRKCTQLEEAASTAEAFTEMQVFASRLEANPPSPNRVELMRQLDSVIGATESQVTIVMNTQLAIASAILASLPTDGQIPFSEIERQIENARPQYEAATRPQVLLSFLFTYQSLSDSEIEKYIEFAGSAAGVKYHETTLNGFKKAMLQSCVRWGNAIGELLANKQERSET